jgi:hypothetical protein
MGRPILSLLRSKLCCHHIIVGYIMERIFGLKPGHRSASAMHLWLGSRNVAAAAT